MEALFDYGKIIAKRSLSCDFWHLAPKRAKPGADISVTRFPLWCRIRGASSSPVNGHVTGKVWMLAVSSIVTFPAIKRSRSAYAVVAIGKRPASNLFRSEVLRHVFVVCKRFCKIKLH